MTVQIHTAGWIVADPDNIVENGCMVVENGLITDIRRRKRFEKSRIMTDHGPGVILPALVNAHTHLELTALAGLVPFDGGFREWVKSLIQTRDEIGPERLIQAAESGADTIKQSGCGLVGDISTTGLSLKPLRRSGLHGVWFQEYIGGLSVIDEQIIKDSVPGTHILTSVAGHGPHTTHPEVLKTAKQFSKSAEAPFSIHLAESSDESVFLTTGKGQWADFLTERGIDFSDWKIPARSPVEYADRIGLLDNRTIAVHLLNIDDEDMAILRKRNVHACCCARSNINLHGEPPDIPGLTRAGLNVCLGVDSPASAPSTNILDEARFVAKIFPDMEPESIFTMITINGATALNCGQTAGTLRKGKKGMFAYLDIGGGGESLFEKIIHFAPSEDYSALLVFPDGIVHPSQA